ncbi:hypothetical protein [Shinella sp. DD12]|uniref:hypothetical protein n=1 Tax=Shinella sp. DD12 TaxID=1410620 RepID=UPI0012DC61B7|nr:hypothetical protein [Shinella sp. DD12]
MSRRTISFILASFAVAATTSITAAETLSTCSSACYPNPTEDCFRVQDSGQRPGIQVGFAWLFEKFASAPQTITKTEIATVFEAGEDECKREDTLIAQAEVKNSGPTACTISTSVSIAGSTFGAGIVIPRTLTTKWKRTPDGTSINLSLDGQDAMDHPFLGFSNNHLQEAWGGLITGVQFSPKSAIIATMNGCIRYDY